MTRFEKKEELIGLFISGLILIGDMLDEAMDFAEKNIEKEATRKIVECSEFLAKLPHWISVDDELPQKLEAVICTNGHDVKVGFYDCDDSGDHVMWAAPCMGCYDVTHWMPLPAPPRGSSGKPNNCKKFDIPGYENVIIHEGNTKGGVL